ncbi:MAG: PQQ-dependent sugar dehydrogenase [Bacteroidetes bacterium]|nr:PQQ-dependent sugar dehydrogenase [Bacteroidota bacterium]
MKIFTLFIVVFSITTLPEITFSQSEPFSKRTVASGFNSAWEIVYGPNDSLWVTENSAYKIDRVSIATGAKTTLISLRTADPSINFTSGSGTQPQGGLMGLAIHPNLYSTNAATRAAKPWVYAVYVYNRGDCPPTNTHCFFTTKIVRFDYNGNTLTNPVTVLDNIPGSSDHNSGRLVISPVIESGSDAAHTQYRLYYTVGDMGAGQFLNTTRTENAQNIDVMEGKVLRLNTESDGDAGLDAWIPNDNPYYEGSTISPKDYVYSYGHRNPQGLVWGNVSGTNLLYSCEQMDRSDDEVNIIEAGKNYGWDKVSGYCDDNVDGYKIGQNTSANESAFCDTASNGREPIYNMYTTDAGHMAALMADGNNANWPTVATSSIDFYGKNKIPGWNYSLLVTPLKQDKVYRMKLNATGSGITGDSISYFRGDGNRIRRIMIAPDGLRFYVARDVGATSNGGAIIEYSYIGNILPLNDNPPAGPVIVKDLIRVYPNPVHTILNVQGKKEMRKPLKVQLYSLSGKMMKEMISFKNEFTVDMSSFPSGVYTLKLYNGDELEMQIEKIMKL